ncbi:MAG: hypothetical protein HY343_09535 [Lentisphaerae bacterium]|nr:hypothetical protein [Lentisphaerota bacterium]
MSNAFHGMRALAVFLAVATVLAGCATPSATFTSTPSGARVTVGDEQGVTPCTLSVPAQGGVATITAGTGEIEQRNLVASPSQWTRAKSVCAGIGGKCCKGIAVPFVGVGLVGLWLLSHSDSPHNADEATDEVIVLGVSLGSLVLGTLFYAAGDCLEDAVSADPARVHIDFPVSASTNTVDMPPTTIRTPTNRVPPWTTDWDKAP